MSLKREDRTLRFVSFDDCKDIKKATRDLIRLNGGIEAVAEDTNYSKSYIGNINNHNDPTFIPVNMILNLERDSDDPVITRMLARKQGYVLIPAQSKMSSSQAAILTARLGKETSDVFAEIAKSIADGAIDPTEAKKCLKEVFDMLKAGHELVDYLKSIMEGK